MVVDIRGTRTLEYEDVLISDGCVDVNTGFERQELRDMARGKLNAKSARVTRC